MSNSKESFEQLRETPSIVASVQAAGQSRIAKTAPKATNSDQQKQRRTVCPLKGQPAETWIRIGIGVGVGESSLAEERNVNKKTNTNTICKDSRDCAVNVLRICSNLLPQLAKLCRAIVDVDAGVAAGLLHSELNAAKIAPHFGVSRAVGCAVAVGARTLLQKEICDDWLWAASGTRGYIRTRPIEASEQTLVSVTRASFQWSSALSTGQLSCGRISVNHLCSDYINILKRKRFLKVQQSVDSSFQNSDL